MTATRDENQSGNQDADTPDIEVAGVGGTPVPMRTILHARTSEFEVRMVSSLDRMQAYMKIIPGPAFDGLTRERIVELAASAGVTTNLIEPGIDLYASLLRPPVRQEDFFQIACGDPMRRGVDGNIEFHVQPTALAPRYDEGENGAIDYRQLNLIENCFAGQRVASILPPGAGRPGRDIFGAELPAVAGSPMQVRAGPGILTSSNGRDFTAEIEGRVVYDKGVISISPLLEILHDVDYSVGNIDFVGKVLVKGSLLDGFRVGGRQGVEITGDMGAAQVLSGGDVVIRGGVKGKNVAFIRCRALSAHYIDDATVEAAGDVVVTKEIMNSSVKSLGRVSIPHGAVIGGGILACRGVEAETIGSEMGVATRIVAGLNWNDEDRLATLRVDIGEYLDRVQSAKMVVEHLLGNREIIAHLAAEQKSMLAELIGEFRDMRERLSDLLDTRMRIIGRDQEGTAAQINVAKTLFMGVSIRFSQAEMPVRDSVTGPLSVTPEDNGKDMRFGPAKKLPEMAREPEETRESGPAQEPGANAPGDPA